MKTLCLFIVFIPGLFLITNAQDWKLAWSDEFEYEGKPDAEKWNYELGYIRNNEKQFYTNRLENAYVKNGVLTIEARKDNYQGKEITSASIITRGQHSWTYGRFEIRAKVPTGRGTWPALWMLGEARSKVGWPECGEIDILEYVGYDPDKVHANIHTKAYNHVKKTNKGNSKIIENIHKDFHIYAMEWNKEKIDFFVDNEKYFSFKNEHKTNDEWPFDKPHYLIMNLAIGGSWGGREGVDEAIFPAKFIIDYVRVYQEK